VESGHVIAVLQNGYMFGERVIRPALVRVAQ
jgi:molecular chaperone GrpE (heat shock protein)